MSYQSRLYDSQGNLIEGDVPDKSVIIDLPNGDRKALWVPFQKQVSFHESQIMNLLARGSRGSGKSDMLRWDAHMRGMTIPNCTMVLIRSTLKQLQQSHLLWIHKEMKELGGYFHGTNYCAHYPTGSRLFFSYVGHEDDALNLLGAELAAAYFDELSAIPWDYFMKLQASVRTKRTSRIKAVTRSATNPFGESAAEIEKFFVHRTIDPDDDAFDNYFPEDWGYIQINMEDNPHIDIDDYKRRLVNLPPHLRKAWLYGEYADEAALFDVQPSKNGKPYHFIDDIDLAKILKAGQIYRAFDMGWHPDPAYCVWIAHLGNRYVAFHEKIWYKTIIPDIAKSIWEEEERLGLRDPREEGATKRVTATFCDPSMDIHTGAEIRTNKGIFEGSGIPMECSVNNRELFATVVHQALAEEAGNDVPRLQMYRGNKHDRVGCPYLIRALPLMRMDPKRTMFMANHQHDHPVVSLAYFLISHAANERRTPEEMKVPRWMMPKTQHSRFTLGDEAVRQR